MRAHLGRVIPVLEGEVVDLLDKTDATDHKHVAAARPHLEKIHKNVRAIVREIAKKTG
jgi:hypothetical protein